MKGYILLALTLFNLIACAQKKRNTMQTTMRADELAVFAITRQLAKLMIARDTAAMNKILDKNYTLTHMTGYVQSKAEWFAEVEKESMKYYSAKEVNHSVVIDDDKATCTIQDLVDARIWGSRNTWHLQQVMQLEKRNGQWTILSSVASVF